MDAVLNFFTGSVWPIIVVIIFFGGSIFVHELGHFLAAKWRGLHIERFSIGFGPKLFGWTKNGVDYRVSLLPLGGYVALPQLADMRGIEGDSSVETANLPPISYSDKVIVAVAGAVFNVIFAFMLATILWQTGKPTSERQTSTEIGYLSEFLTNAEGQTVNAPARQAGIKVGDKIVSIDGNETSSYEQIQSGILFGNQKDDTGKRISNIEVERDGQRLSLTIYPILSERGTRQIGIDPGFTVVLKGISPDPNAPANITGLQNLDHVLEFNGIAVRNWYQFLDLIRERANQPTSITIKRDGKEIEMEITPKRAIVNPEGTIDTRIGSGMTTIYDLAEVDPFTQIKDVAVMTATTLSALIDTDSDIGLSLMSGPVGIASIIHDSAKTSILYTLWIAVVININLAIFNLLPIPVLDGGHIVFATIAKLRRKALPINLVASLQGGFMILLFGLIIYVSYFDVGRLPKGGGESFTPKYLEPGESIPTSPAEN